MRNRLTVPSAIIASITITVLLFAISAQTADSHRIQVYSAQTTYVVETMSRDGAEYIGLFELLEPLGRVDASAKGKTWHLNFVNNAHTVESEFRDGKEKAKINGAEVDLGGKFVLSSGRGYVPLASIPNIVPRLSEQTVQWHAGSRKLLVGTAGMKITAELRRNPTRLVLTFPGSVTPTIANEGNKIRMVFTREPIVSSGADNVSYNEAPISTTSFAETSTGAEFVVHGSGPLRADVSGGGRTITISAQQPSATTATAPAAPPAPAQPSAPSQSQSQKPARAAVPGPKPFTVVIDPAHGGTDTGAKLSDKLLEKDVSLVFARRLNHELQQRGINAVLLRNGDTQLNIDQRAVSANAANPKVFLSLHASAQGHGLRLFMAMMPPSASQPAKRSFAPWRSAQASWLDSSAEIAGSISAECNRKQLAVRALSAAVPPLSNIAAPALALEIAPQDDDIASVNASDYQQSYAVAIANAIADLRGRLEEAQ